tara:strand:- start:1227 stop:1604 length:378 start_codon:yes stop_codon:yes gene_type:complete
LVLVEQLALGIQYQIKGALEEIQYLEISPLLEEVVGVDKIHQAIELVYPVDLVVVVQCHIRAERVHIQVHQTPIHLEWDMTVDKAQIMGVIILPLLVVVALVVLVLMELHRMVLVVLVVQDHRLQ